VLFAQVFGESDAAVVGGCLTLVGVLVTAWWARSAVHQTKPNGGNSMRDVLDDVRKMVSFLSDDVVKHREDMAEVRKELRVQSVRLTRLEFPDNQMVLHPLEIQEDLS
jgi:hypothetical protein